VKYIYKLLKKRKITKKSHREYAIYIYKLKTKLCNTRIRNTRTVKYTDEKSSIKHTHTTKYSVIKENIQYHERGYETKTMNKMQIIGVDEGWK